MEAGSTNVDRTPSMLYRDGLAEFEDIWTQNRSMRKWIARARLVAPYDMGVLILGETGTRSLCARGVREDLYYRLNAIRIHLPPLSERAEDLPALVECLFERVCADARRLDTRLADTALGALRAYAWPGNICELENALRHALAFAEGPEIQPANLPEPL